MGALRTTLELAIGSPLELRERPPAETLRAGALELPRGALTEIAGPASAGRTSLLVSILAATTGREEVCALIDAADVFDPISAAAAGVELSRVLWVRCGGSAEIALKAVDLLVQAGGFGVIALDLADSPDARRISMTSWFRLRRAVEHTQTVLVAVEREPLAKTAASLVVEVRREREHWPGLLFRGWRTRLERRKPRGEACTLAFTR